MRGALLATALLAGCAPIGPDAEELTVRGTLERDALGGTDAAGVDVAFHSRQARAEFWPCDLHLTAGGCVGDHHVNVYVGLPGVVELAGIGRADCVVDGVPDGVFEAFQRKTAGDFSVGGGLSVFVVVASDTKAPAGADLLDDDETTAAARLVEGTLTVLKLKEDALALTIAGKTTEGHDVDIAFGGPSSTPASVAVLEGPSTCVDTALVSQ